MAKEIVYMPVTEVAAISPLASGMAQEPPPPFKQWAQENLVIPYRQGGMGLWKDWSYGQCAIDDHVEQCIADGVPVMIVIPKIRQFAGMSVYCQGRIFHNGHFRDHQTSFVFAHEATAAQQIFRKISWFYDFLPQSEKDQRPPLLGDKVHKQHMQYGKPWESYIEIGTASSVHKIRSWKLDCAHVSELAFFKDPETFATALGSCMPIESNPFVQWYLESTCWNRGYFDKMIVRGLNAKRNRKVAEWVTLFLSWVKEPKCRRIIQVKGEFVPDEREVKYMEDKKKEGVVLDLEQMYWHSTYRKDICGESWEQMFTEMPTTLDEARSFTGRPWFDQMRCDSLLEAIDQDALDNRFFEEISEQDWPVWCYRMPNKAVVPIFRGRISWVKIGISAEQSFLIQKALLEPDHLGSLLIWEHPVRGIRYVIGVDAAHGLGLKGDYTDITVMRCDTGIVVAHYRNSFIKPGDAGDVVCRLGVYYNMARLWVEWNGPGSTMLLAITQSNRTDTPLKDGYPNIKKDENVRKETSAESDRIGFTTHGVSKANLMDNLTADFSKGLITTYSEQQLLQMRGLGCEPNKAQGSPKKWIHIANHQDPFTGMCADDSIMSLGLANEGRRESRGESQWIPVETENF